MKPVLARIALDAESSVDPATLTKWIQIFPMGVPPMNDYRKLKVEADDCAAVLRNFARKRNKVAVLFEHGHGPRGGVAAGWISALEVRVDGMYARITWLEDTAEEIREGKWKYMSPGFLGLVDDEEFVRPRALVEASLTNIPAIDGMKPVEASSELMSAMADDLSRLVPGTVDGSSIVGGGSTPPAAPLASASCSLTSNTTGTATSAGNIIWTDGMGTTGTWEIVPATQTFEVYVYDMVTRPAETKPKEEPTIMDMDKLRTLLELDAQASEADIEAKITDLKAKAAEMSVEPEEAVEPEITEVIVDVTEEEFAAKVETEATLLAAEMVAKRDREEKATRLLEAGVRAGKIVAAKREIYAGLIAANPEAMEEVLADLPEIAPVTPALTGKDPNVSLAAKKDEKGRYNLAAKLANKRGISMVEALDLIDSEKE